MTSQTEKVFEEMLLLSAQAGDRLAANRLATRWQPRLLRTARRHLRDSDLARDVVQEAWLAICSGWSGIRDPSRFPAWAFGVLRHKSADAIRKASLSRDRFADLPMEEQPVTDRSETLTSLDQVFAMLSPDLRLTAILFYGEGLNLVETATATGVPVGTVKSRLHSARGIMKSALGAPDEKVEAGFSKIRRGKNES